MRDDLKHALRRLWQQPGFTVTAVLTLALGLGANISIFTLLHGVMFRELPVTRPSELFRLGADNNCCVNSGLQRRYSLFSYPLYEQLREALRDSADLAAFQASTSVTAIRPEHGRVSQSAPAAYVSGNYFTMLGVTAAVGRLIGPSDDVPGAPPVMVMSDRTWREQFNADPGLVGRAFYINGTPVTRPVHGMTGSDAGRISFRCDGSTSRMTRPQPCSGSPPPMAEKVK